MNVSRLKKLKAAISAQADLCVELIDAMLPAEEDVEDEVLACPHCGNADEEKLVESSDFDVQNRMTCTECGKSFLIEKGDETDG